MKRYLMVFLVAALFGSLSGVSFNIGYSLGYRNGAEEQESWDKFAAVMELTKQIGEETRLAREKLDVFLKALEEKADEVKAQEEAPELIDIGDAGRTGPKLEKPTENGRKK